MKKLTLLICFMLIVGGFLSAQEFTGDWELETNLIQVIQEGMVFGFANPDTEKQIEKINFLGDDNVILIYDGTEYPTRWFQDGKMLFFETPNGESLIITLLKTSEGTFQFSYCLASAKEELVSGIQKSAFVNYIGTMSKNQ